MLLFAYQELQRMKYESYVRQVGGRLAALREEMGEDAFDAAFAQANDRLRQELAAAREMWAERGDDAHQSGAASTMSTDDLLAELEQLEGDPAADAARVEATRYRTAVELLRRGRADQAVAVLDRSVAYERGRGPSRDLAVSLLARAQALAAVGRSEEALADLGEAGAWAEAAGDAELTAAFEEVRRLIQRPEDDWQPWR